MLILQSIFLFCYQILNYRFHWGLFSFTLWNVFVFSVVGSIVAKIIYSIFHFYND